MFTHLPGTSITCAKSLGGAALVVLCTGHLGKSVTSHVRAHVWEGPAFESSQHKRSWAVPRSDSVGISLATPVLGSSLFYKQEEPFQPNC